MIVNIICFQNFILQIEVLDPIFGWFWIVVEKMITRNILNFKSFC